MRRRILTLMIAAVLLSVGQVSAQTSTPPLLDRTIVSGNQIQSGYQVGVSEFDTSRVNSPVIGNANGYLDVHYVPTKSPGVLYITKGDPQPYKNDDDKHQLRDAIDVSSYAALVIRMWGGSSFPLSVGIKSTDQKDYGFETKVQVNITPQPQEFYFPLSWFATRKSDGTYEGVQLNQLYVVSELVFNQDAERTLSISSIRFTADGYASNKVAPYLAFGGGWSTSFFLTNTSGARVKFPMNFIGLDGQSLAVPVSGSGSDSSTIGLEIGLEPRATSEVDITSDGPLTQGYVQVALPDDVSAYSLLRLRIPQQPDQQAIIPFADTAARSATLVVDEVASVTTAVIVNVDNAANRVNIAVHDERGRVLGTTTASLSAHGSSAVILRNIPELSAIAGRRGSVDFTSTNGSRIVVLGLRFNGAAFTAIPARTQ